MKLFALFLFILVTFALEQEVFGEETAATPVAGQGASSGINGSVTAVDEPTAKTAGEEDHEKDPAKLEVCHKRSGSFNAAICAATRTYVVRKCYQCVACPTVSDEDLLPCENGIDDTGDPYNGYGPPEHISVCVKSIKVASGNGLPYINRHCGGQFELKEFKSRCSVNENSKECRCTTDGCNGSGRLYSSIPLKLEFFGLASLSVIYSI